MLNRLDKKQKKLVKIALLVLMFIWNTLFSVICFFEITLGELLNYILNDFTILTMDGNEIDYYFSNPEIWGWYVIISTVIYFAAYITYIVLSIKSIKKHQITKTLCLKCLGFSIVFSILQLMPMMF